MEEDWNKNDIGKIIIYLNLSRKKEKVAISEVYENTPHTLGVVDYPISLDSKISLLGLRKNQEKKDFSLLEKTGEWCFLGEVSKDDREELNRIASYPKNFLE